MKYMLLIYLNELDLSEDERQDCYQKSSQLVDQLKADGKYLAASPLQPTALATSVRVREGKQFITDGPFAETHEQLGGYYLVDSNNLDDAINIAKQIPMAKKGTVEIRPVIELEVSGKI
ncbi:MAG: YciI family protein [Methylophilaceae bacterium]|nr:YciI family protein [Methylophilaceae bacterium]